MDDLISRQQVLDAIVQCTNCGDEDTLREYVLKHSLDNGWTGGILEALDAVKDLPPAQPEPAIPLSWIEKYIEWLKSLDNEFVNLAAAHISVMVKKWRDEKKMSELIDRQAALDALDKRFDNIPMEQTAEILMLRKDLRKLPTIQPEPHEGEWVQIQRCTGDAQPDLECPFCKHRIGWWDMGRYCAGCGAKLEGGAG